MTTSSIFWRLYGAVVLGASFYFLLRMRRRVPRQFPSSPSADRPKWSDVPRSFEIDLSAVRSRDQFMKAMAPHFPVGPDHRNLWRPIYSTIGMQSCPIRIRFLGWSGFAERMPRYARRLRGYLMSYQKRHGAERLYLDFGA